MEFFQECLDGPVIPTIIGITPFTRLILRLDEDTTIYYFLRDGEGKSFWVTPQGASIKLSDNQYADMLGLVAAYARGLR